MQTCKPHKSTILKSCSIQIYEFRITMECIIYRSILRSSYSLAEPFVSSILSSIAVKMIQKVLRAKQLWFTVQLQAYKFLSCVATYIFPVDHASQQRHIICQCPESSRENVSSYRDYWVMHCQKRCVTFGCIARLSVDFQLL